VGQLLGERLLLLELRLELDLLLLQVVGLRPQLVGLGAHPALGGLAPQHVLPDRLGDERDQGERGERPAEEHEVEQAAAAGEHAVAPGEQPRLLGVGRGHGPAHRIGERGAAAGRHAGGRGRDPARAPLGHVHVEHAQPPLEHRGERGEPLLLRGVVGREAPRVVEGAARARRGPPELGGERRPPREHEPARARLGLAHGGRHAGERGAHVAGVLDEPRGLAVLPQPEVAQRADDEDQPRGAHGRGELGAQRRAARTGRRLALAVGGRVAVGPCPPPRGRAEQGEGEHEEHGDRDAGAEGRRGHDPLAGAGHEHRAPAPGSRVEVRRRHADVVHPGDRAAHEQRGGHERPEPDLAGGRRGDDGRARPDGGHGPEPVHPPRDRERGERRAHGDGVRRGHQGGSVRDARRAPGRRAREPHGVHAEVVHAGDGHAHGQPGGGERAAPELGARGRGEGQRRRGDGHEPRQEHARHVVGDRDGPARRVAQVEGEHAHEVHAPDAGAEGDGAAGQPREARAPATPRHLAGQVEGGVGGEGGDHQGGDDQRRIVGAKHAGWLASAAGRRRSDGSHATGHPPLAFCRHARRFTSGRHGHACRTRLAAGVTARSGAR
jgi:hypothetical protein